MWNISILVAQKNSTDLIAEMMRLQVGLTYIHITLIVLEMQWLVQICISQKNGLLAAIHVLRALFLFIVRFSYISDLSDFFFFF